MDDGRPRVLVLGGSLARPSHTGTLIRTIRDALDARGAEAEVWDLAERPLPFADPAYHRDPASHPSPDVRRLVALADRADALVLASPIYHNSYSGLLKNALDHLALPQFEGKPVGLASNAGRLPLTHAVDHLRQVVRGLGGIAIPTQVATTGQDYALADGQYRLVSPEVRERIDRFAGELVWLAARLAGADRADAEPAAAPAGRSV